MAYSYFKKASDTSASSTQHLTEAVAEVVADLMRANNEPFRYSKEEYSLKLVGPDSFRLEGKSSRGRPYSANGKVTIGANSSGLNVTVSVTDFEIEKEEVSEIPRELLDLESKAEALFLDPLNNLGRDADVQLRYFKKYMDGWRAGSPDLIHFKGFLKLLVTKKLSDKGPLMKPLREAISIIHDLPGGKA